MKGFIFITFYSIVFFVATFAGFLELWDSDTTSQCPPLIRESKSGSDTGKIAKDLLSLRTFHIASDLANAY